MKRMRKVGPTQSMSARRNSTRVWKSSPQRSAILTEPFYAASFSSLRTSKYMSVGYYPARGYQPLAEFGGTKKLFLLLNDQQLQTMAANIAALCDALSTNEYYTKKDVDFRMNTTGSYRVARVYLGKQYLTFT
jgi:hypothetical protein